MNGYLVDSNVILNLLLADPVWVDWSESILTKTAELGELFINPIIYTEISIGFDRIEDLEKAITLGGFQMLDLPKEALFLAGKAFLAYRKNRGGMSTPLPDFFVGAHAAVAGLEVITRDPRRIGAYFPTVRLVSPE